MNSFDSPMQSLPPFTYDHLLTIVLNNVWTCLAVLSAAGAVRFLITTNKYSPSFSDKTPSVCNEKPDPVHSCCQQLWETVAKPASADDCREGIVTRGKFVEYYYEAEEEVDRESYDEGESEVEEVVDGGGEYWELFRVRESEMGRWYRYQDLTVFSGNVVRLWDDHRLI